MARLPVHRTTPDQLADLPNAGHDTGTSHKAGGPDVSQAAMARGFIKPGLPRGDSVREQLSDTYDVGGALSRPGGWER